MQPNRRSMRYLALPVIALLMAGCPDSTGKVGSGTCSDSASGSTVSCDGFASTTTVHAYDSATGSTKPMSATQVTCHDSATGSTKPCKLVVKSDD